MPDDLINRGRSDRAQINVNEAHEVRYWTQELGITEELLRELVSRLGTSPSKLREAVANRR